MKRPSFQFYPADWLTDTALRVVSVGARGAWIEMLCIMHQAEPYGHLLVNHKVIQVDNLARMLGATLPETEGWLTELRDAGVFDIDADGCIVSRRMVRDEKLRQVRAAAGKLGGNPALRGDVLLIQKDKQNPTTGVKQIPTPSSSSSSSSSPSKQERASASRGTRLPADWKPNATETVWAENERPDVNVAMEAAKFADYWHGVAGAKGVKLDWTGTWRNWIRRADGVRSGGFAAPTAGTPRRRRELGA